MYEEEAKVEVEWTGEESHKFLQFLTTLHF